MSRKSKTALQRNIGGAWQSDELPLRSTAWDAVLLVERLLLGLLRDTVDKIREDSDEATRFFSHFYDPTAGADQVKEYVKRFIARPPHVVLGYARAGARFPCIAVVMENEDESEAFLADAVGQDDIDSEGDPSEYTGALWDSTYAVFVYAEHPDECMYLYQFAKAIIHGGKGYLLSCGVLDVHLSGGELAPDQNYMPDNMFVRVLRVTAKAPMSVPHLLTAHPRKIRVTGIFREDVVVDGVRGGVVTYDPEVEDGEQEG